MMKNKVFFGVVAGVMMWSLVFGPIGVLPVLAASPGAVVINEVAWAGSVDSASDEWIELFNTTGLVVDLNGWTIVDDEGASVYALNGTIAPYGYYLIEKREVAVNPHEADLIVNLSLANTGDSLVLFDGTGQVIDAVNTSGGMWFAGNTSVYASMERISAYLSGDDPANWASSTGAGSSATASGGALIVGTPGMVNSVSAAPAVGTNVVLNVSDDTPLVGGELVASVDVENVADLFSYGFEILYDPEVLMLSAVSRGPFLSENETVEVAFQYGLEDGVAGKLLVAEARMLESKSGANGSGNLFTVVFEVIGGQGALSEMVFGPDGFIANSQGEVDVNLIGAQFVPSQGGLIVAPATNLQIIPAAQRYSIQLSWNPSADAHFYRVYRMNPHGNFVLLGDTVSALFVDSDSVAAGGNIIPHHDYVYRVIAVREDVLSDAVEANGTESRGIKGDNDRSDRVDGRDLDNLARQFALADTDAGFDPLVDTTYDGMIDGSDLIDLGASFALTYS